MELSIKQKLELIWTVTWTVAAMIGLYFTPIVIGVYYAIKLANWTPPDSGW